MKTFTHGPKACRPVFRPARSLSHLHPKASGLDSQSPLRTEPSFLRALRHACNALARALCIERNGMLMCALPGAPIVRLPHNAKGF